MRLLSFTRLETPAAYSAMHAPWHEPCNPACGVWCGVWLLMCPRNEAATSHVTPHVGHSSVTSLSAWLQHCMRHNLHIPVEGHT